VNFSDPNLSLEGIQQVSNELIKYGVVGYCPTLISSPVDVYKHNLPLLSSAAQSKKGAKILGIHLEGPFISPKYGFRGIHPIEYILPPSIELFENFRSWSQDRIALITLAPELKDALKLIEYIRDNSKIVASIGHLDADKRIIQYAVNAGIQAATHVGNGIPTLIDRHKNPLWSILAEDRITGFFITDGFHVPSKMIKACLKAKGISQFIVTSDLVHLAGVPPGDYLFHGKPVTLEVSGLLHQKNGPQLAGSTCTMMECMKFLAVIEDLDETALYKIGYENALKLLDVKIEMGYLNQVRKMVFSENKFRFVKQEYTIDL
jgi:N-acetylglucosamine-6-phosphate deacetylase